MRQQPARPNIVDILRQRAQLITEIQVLRERGDTSRLIHNAEHLLTRWWSTATWSGREQLLKSADWLVRVAKVRGE